VFATRDGKQILISIQSDREWVKLCTEMLGDPSLAQDPRFATNVARVQNRSDTDALVAAAFASKNQGTAIDSLSNADVAFASLNDMAALSTHPHLRKIAIETPEGVVNCPAPAPVIRGVVRTYGSVPALGVHSQLPVQQT
jgi:crotonobetainyl-CoA:carnitine CoA-transferase CaiB-like acyl-CoA transferase